ncbi:hypothetical protein [Ornithobacterium rhinotracheale]|uniref:hypothetical protein n=1 Tax=Ornithobacterium rhinotracheale TaxID=28251 RepID=UPI0012DF4B18|nr:hypothetical protein [Ornithobacterium rhinotracheale]
MPIGVPYQISDCIFLVDLGQPSSSRNNRESSLYPVLLAPADDLHIGVCLSG